MNHLQSRVDQQVLILTLDRPAKKNALTADMYQALADAVSQADGRDDVAAVLLRGAAGNFSSGNDISLFVQGHGHGHGRSESPALAFMQAVLGLRKPLVACVRGHAVGIGATVLLHCDYVVASDDARIRFPFVDLALCPEFGSTLLLSRIVGRAKASEWLLLGAAIPAAQACQAGLVNQVLPAELAEEEALSVAKRLAAKPRQALAATRALLRQADEEGLLRRLQQESATLNTLRQSAEAQALFKSFLERQPSMAASGQ
ncbi:MAG TPA: enoyl-CoA hydratase-related protein [Rubrivivax sp.]|nr:enoyl-CoA hydratase-related protein [Rubrivivax sp.]